MLTAHTVFWLALLVALAHANPVTLILPTPIIDCEPGISVASCTVCRVLNDPDDSSVEYAAFLNSLNNEKKLIDVEAQDGLIALNDLAPSTNYELKVSGFYRHDMHSESNWSLLVTFVSADASVACTGKHLPCACSKSLPADPKTSVSFHIVFVALPILMSIIGIYVIYTIVRR